MSDQPNVFESTTCLLLRFHKVGLTRKGDVNKIQAAADKKRLGLNKKILVSDAYDNLLLVARDCRRYVKARQVPSPFAEGTHLLPLALVGDVDDKVENAVAGFDRFADQFVGQYPRLIEEAREELKDQFDIGNYHTDMERLRSLFYVERRYFDFGPPSAGKVGQAIADREMRKQATEIQDLASKVKAGLRVGLKKLIDHLVDRLTPGEDGKRKQFAPTTVTKVVDFLQLFEARNIVRDNELAVLAKQASDILQGVDPVSLKKDENLSAYVTTQMSDVKGKLDTLVEAMPERMILLDDDTDD